MGRTIALEYTQHSVTLCVLTCVHHDWPAHLCHSLTKRLTLKPVVFTLPCHLQTSAVCHTHTHIISKKPTQVSIHIKHKVETLPGSRVHIFHPSPLLANDGTC